MKVLALLFTLVPSLALALPIESFSGFVRGDYTASCRINQVSVQFIPEQNGNYSLTWVEQGNKRPPFQGYCENNFMAILKATGFTASGAPYIWDLDFNFFQNDTFSFATLTEDVLRINSKIVDNDGYAVSLKAEMLFKENKTMTYVRTFRANSGATQDVVGLLIGN